MSLMSSGFWFSFLAINISLAYAVYPQALLGRLSVAPVAYLAIGAYATTYFTTRGGSFFTGLAVGIAISTVIGAILSAVAGHLRSHFFVAATLGAVMIVQQAAFSLTPLTNGYLGVTSPADLIQWWHVWLLAILCMAGAASLRHSVLDGVWRAVGADDRIASALGISTSRAVFTAGTVSAVIATIAGGLYGHLLPFFDPNAFGLLLILVLAAGIVVGGVVAWYGPVIGAVIMTGLPELLRDFGAWRDSSIGLILIACILFLPRGLSDRAGIVKLWNAMMQVLARRKRARSS